MKKRLFPKLSINKILTSDIEESPSQLTQSRQKLIGGGIAIFAVLIGGALILRGSALTNQFIAADVSANLTGTAGSASDGAASGGSYIRFAAAPSPTPTPTPTPTGSNYQANLAKILGASVRNTNEDNSQFINTPSAQLPTDNSSPLFGPRSDYMDPHPDGHPGFQEVFAGNPESDAGIFRVSCEFSHFGYDDPIVYPNMPQAAHLHMFFGNTHTNAYSSYDTLFNSGGGTCNGRELNRTAYWVPAIIDGNGNARVPEKIMVYYKTFGYNFGNKTPVTPYPEGMAFVENDSFNKSSGAQYASSFLCKDDWNSPAAVYGNSIPTCSGTGGNPGMNLEQNIKFKQCWDGQTLVTANMNDDTFVLPNGSFWGGTCPASHPILFTNLEYRIWYRVEAGENTSSWFLSSDVSRGGTSMTGARGNSNHADWWGGWNRTVLNWWVQRCNNVSDMDCGHGFLGGDSVSDPFPALRYRLNYKGPIKASGQQLYNQICNIPKTISQPADLAYCGSGNL